jgi:HK97 family phage major capsid protein
MAEKSELDKKVEEINAENNKLIHDLQVENDRKLEGKVTKTDFAEYERKVLARMDELNTEVAKLKIPPLTTNDEKVDVKARAFSNFLRKGYDVLAPEERKVLTIADSTHAGVLAPLEYVNQIIKMATLQNPVRQLATVRQTSAFEIQIPTETAIGAAAWVAESAEKTETTGLTYALITIIPQEMYILYKATQKMLEDSAFNLEAEIASAIGRGFGLLEGTAFYGGNGTTTGPKGIVIDATVAADANPLNTHDTLTFDDFLETQYLLASPYVPNASWILNRGTMGSILALKSATTNMYLVQPNLLQGQPATILGSPVYEWADIPIWAAVASQYIAMYGDFRRGYCVVDRVDISIQRLVEKYAEFGMVGFLARKRVGGGVILPEAIQLLKNTAS